MIYNIVRFLKSIIKPIKVQSLGIEPPKANVGSDGTNKTKFYLNDPTTPNLIGVQEHTQTTVFPMLIKEDKGGGYPLGSVEQQASACKIIVNNLLSYLVVLNKLANTNSKLSGWANKGTLAVLPRAGEDLNAYYDRRSLKFFYYKTKEKFIYSCNSTPVVTHEFGHAFLDAIRPDFWSAQSFEVWAYHESFGDMASIISSLQSDDLINEAIKETKGDLLKSNVITRIGAEMGQTYYNILKNKNGALPTCLRDASIVYKYVKPELLPSEGPDNILIRESHNFSRVFTGAFYEMCVRVAQKVLQDGSSKNMLDALKISRDICSRYLLKATCSSPMTTRLFEAIAKNILATDKNEGSKYQEVIRKVFLDRNIISTRILMLGDKNIVDIEKELKNEQYEMETVGSGVVIRTLSTKSIKILDKRILSLKNNHLYGLKIDVPSQTSYHFDDKNNLVDVIGSSEDEVIDDAIECLDYLDKNKLIGNNSEALFEIKSGKIIRKQIKCKCGLPNYCDPNAPEFNKPWKPANNSSCCKGDAPRSCGCQESSSKSIPRRSYCSSKTSIFCYGKYVVGQFLKRKVCSN